MRNDESYVIDLCDTILGEKGLRQHTFDFLRGDTGRRLPVDAYYEQHKLVVEYRERQHTEAVPFFDDKGTASGVPRGEQRALYDQRRRDLLPIEGISLIELSYADFEHNSQKRLVRADSDIEIVERKLGEWVNAPQKK